MAYARSGLGDVGTDVTNELTLLNQAAQDIQTGFNQLADKLRSAGTQAVRVSNATTGAAAGAKVGAQAGSALPTSVVDALSSVPKPVLYGVGALALWKLLR